MPPITRGGQTAGRVLQLAGELQADLARRRLKPGARFLSVDEVVAARSVRRDVANKALQILAQRGLIVRRPRVGAVVCAPPAAATLARVHLLAQEDDPQAEAHDFTGVVLGLQSRLPGCDVRFAALSAGDMARQVDAVIRAAMRARAPEGFILVRCAYALQRQVADCGLPAVVAGSTWPGLPLPSVNIDNEAAGVLHAAALWAKGCRRILLLRRERLVPGEACFARGVRTEMARRGAPADAVDQIELPSEPAVVRAALAAWPAGGAFGVVAATVTMAKVARSALPPQVPVHVGVVQGGADSQDCPFTHATEANTPEAEGILIAAALLARLHDPAAPAAHRSLPMRLVMRG